MADGGGQHPICAVTGKRIYKRHQAAAKAVGKMQKTARGAAASPNSIYQCDHCGRWHLTSYSPQLTRAIQHDRRERKKTSRKRRRQST